MNVRLRDYVETDAVELDRLWQEHWSAEYSLPHRKSRVVDSVAVRLSGKQEKIVGYGQVKLFAEAMLFLDPTATKRQRSEATRLLMQKAIRGAESAGLDMYAFIRDPDFSLLIQHHYQFERVTQPGELLVRLHV